MIAPEQQKLSNYYRHMGIYPESFNCKNQGLCRSYTPNKMTETKMSMVGSKYGNPYPRIVVISLDPPSGENKKFTEKYQRTTDYVSSISEEDDFNTERLFPHWAMTQIIVKDIISLFGYIAKPHSAVVIESYSGRSIENVSAYFSHVNVAKCSMNNPHRGQAPRIVHETCSSSYLLEEIKILDPEILITQGKTTNQILGRMLVGNSVEESQLPRIELITISSKKVLWLPMHHPTRQLDKIRSEWSFYEKAILNWARENS